jgi:Domain of unknown function (DUF4476)
MSLKKSKFFLVAFALVCMALPSLAQKTNLVFFADGGEKFILSINGVRQNATPDTNVKARDLQGDAVQALIEFSTAIRPVKQLVALQPGMELTFAVRKNKKGAYVLRMVSTAAISESATLTQKSSAVESKPATATTTPTPTNNVTTQTQTTQTVSTPVSATTVTTDGASVNINVSGTTTQTPDNANVNISVSGVNTNTTQTQDNANVNISVSGVNTKTTQTVKTTTRTSSSSTDEMPVRKSEPVRSEPVKSQPAACTSAMLSTDFDRARKSIEAKSFTEEQMTICTQVIKANCFSVKQVLSLMEIFTYEESKLSVAKLAYPKTIDKNNYYQINDAFSYSSTVEALNKFMEEHE